MLKSTRVHLMCNIAESKDRNTQNVEHATLTFYMLFRVYFAFVKKEKNVERNKERY